MKAGEWATGWSSVYVVNWGYPYQRISLAGGVRASLLAYRPRLRTQTHVWTWDFVHDTTMRGGKLRMLTVLDEYTRESRCIHVDRKINAEKVQCVMARLIEEYGVPEHICSDNGSEFIEKNLREWLSSAAFHRSRVWIFDRPDRPVSCLRFLHRCPFRFAS